MTTVTLTITIPFSGSTLREVDYYFTELLGVTPLAVGFNAFGPRKRLGSGVKDGGGKLTRFDVTLDVDDVLPVAEWLNRTEDELERDFAGTWAQVA